MAAIRLQAGRSSRYELNDSTFPLISYINAMAPSPNSSMTISTSLLRTMNARIGSNACVAVLGCSNLDSLTPLLGEIAPQAHIIALGAKIAGSLADASVAAFETISQMIGNLSGESLDLIIDAGDYMPIDRTECLVGLAPYLKPGGLYLILDPAGEKSWPNAEPEGNILATLYLLSDLLNGQRLHPSGLPIASQELDSGSSWPAGKLHGYLKTLFEKIEIWVSAAVLYRGDIPATPLPAESRLTSADLPWSSQQVERRLIAIVDNGSKKAVLQASDKFEYRTVSALIAENTRLVSAVARRDLDLIALEDERGHLNAAIMRERNRLKAALDRERYLLHNGALPTLRRGIRNVVRHILRLLLTPIRRIAEPIIRNLLR